MASYGMKGTGVDAREVALAAKGRVAVDAPTAEVAFVRVERPAQNGSVRSIMILYQRWVQPTGRKYWREVIQKTEADITRENAVS